MLKHELRKKYKSLRNQLTAEHILNNSISIVNQLQTVPLWDFFCFHTFLSIPENREIDTEPLLTLLQGKDKDIVVPKVTGPNALKHYLLTDNTRLKTNKWHIPEPVNGYEVKEAQIDVVFVPLMAFDPLGNRVGYGKGFYDTFLAKCREDSVFVGLSFFEAEPEPIPDVHPNDVPLHYCVTPKTVYQFKR
ncbi:MAG: 5-formyltetrahydrofolate cyclo-ligase [Bacteroidota bacterium]